LPATALKPLNASRIMGRRTDLKQEKKLNNYMISLIFNNLGIWLEEEWERLLSRSGSRKTLRWVPGIIFFIDPGGGPKR